MFLQINSERMKDEDNEQPITEQELFMQIQEDEREESINQKSDKNEKSI
jgi:hypothetical protein